MSGVVGNSNIRNDIRQTVRDRTPQQQLPNLSENAGRLRQEPLVQPLERARTTEVSALVDFYKIFKKVLETATEMDDTQYPINFTLEFPPREAVLPCFTTRLISRRPWSFNGRKEMSPRFMQEYADPDYPGEVTQEYLVRQENIIEVTVWAKTMKVTNEMAEWLEDKFWEYLWALQWSGTSHPVDWLGRGSDIYEEVREQQMYGAPVTFRVITGKITKKRSTTIRKLAISLGLLIEN